MEQPVVILRVMTAHTVHSPIDETCVYGVTVAAAADVMLTSNGAYYEVRGDL
jgi:hypothetical protein